MKKSTTGFADGDTGLFVALGAGDVPELTGGLVAEPHPVSAKTNASAVLTDKSPKNRLSLRALQG